MDQPPSLDKTYGAAFIGMVVAAALYGVSCSQTFYYFQHHSERDGRGIKAVVIATLISDTIHQAVICHAIYSYLITNYFRPQELSNLVWSLPFEVIPNAITTLLVQSFFAVRIWKFSGRNAFIAVPLAILILGEFVSAIVYVAKGITMTTFAQITVLKPLSMVVNVLAVAGDVYITVVFSTLLRRARNNLQRSNTMINLLVAFTVQTGMLTSLCAIACLISINVSPGTFIYIAFYFILGRLYCNSLLAALNIRKAIRGRGQNDLGISLRRIGVSGFSTEDSHKGTDVKAEIVGVETHGYIKGDKAHSYNGSSPLVRSTSNANDSRVVETGFDVESGQPQHLRRASSY